MSDPMFAVTTTPPVRRSPAWLSSLLLMTLGANVATAQGAPSVPQLTVARESIEGALTVDLDAEGTLDYAKTGGLYERQQIKKFVAPIAAPESWKIRRNVAFNPDPAGNLGFNYPAFAAYGQVGPLQVSSFTNDRVDFLYSDAWCWAGQVAAPVGGETTVTTSGEGSANNGFSYGCALEASDTETRVARIYNGGYATKVRMDLSWDEFQTIAHTSIFDPLTDLAPYDRGDINFANKYTIQFKATAPGQWLSVRFTALTPTYRAQYATLRFAAVTLAAVPELTVARESIEGALTVDLDAEGTLDYAKTGGLYERQQIKKFVAPIAAPESWKIRRNVAFNPDPAGNLGFNYPAFAAYGQVGALQVSSWTNDRVDFLYSDAWCWAGQVAAPVGGETTVTTSGEGSANNGFSYGCALEASDTETRVARIYNGGYATQVRMDLSWDEFQTIAHTSIFDPLTDLAPYDRGDINFANKYTIQFKATAPGQWLSVRFTALTPTYRAQYATLRFAAVTLAGSDNTPPTVTITAPADESVTSAPSTTVSAAVTDDSATTVTSTPVGVIDEALSAPGGMVSGTAPLSEGANAITVSATDAGNNTSSTSITIYRDSMAPAVTISPGEGTIVSAPLSNFGITVTDQTLTSVTVGGTPAGSAAVDNGVVYGTSSATLTGEIPVWNEGPNSIVVVATDAAGNTTTVTRTVILDSTAPVIEILWPQNGACFTSNPPSGIPLSATIYDTNATEITGALTGSLPACGGTISGTFVLQEGLNSISITATNPGLNPPVFATQTVNVTLDTIAPTVTITSPGDQACVRGIVEVHATATDVLPGTVTATAYFVDNLPIAPTGIDPVLYLLDTTTLADGAHTVQVDATDSCGNESSTSITIQVDNTAPELTIQNPLDLSWVAGNVAFDASASDLGTGLAAITMTAAGRAPATDGSQQFLTPVNSAFATSLVDTVAASNGIDGDLELEVTVRDCAGNTTTVAVTVHVDNNPPETAITAPADGSTVRCLLDIKAAVDEPNLASVQFIVDGIASPVLTASPFEIPFDTRNRLDGDLPITLIVTDLADNVTTRSINVTVDNLEVELEPETLELKSRGGDKSVTAKIEGQSALLLASVNPQDITLCVPGGSPIPATRVFGFHLGWHCDHEHESSHRGHRRGHEHGHHGSESEVKVKFDRQLLLGALRGAGLTDGKVEMTIKVTQNGQTFVIGSDKVRVKSGGGHH